MAQKFNGYFPDPIDFIIPVPLYPTAERIRGYNQALRLAEALALRLQIPVLNALARIRLTQAQHRLNRVQRQENVEGAFGLSSDTMLQKIKGKRLLLLDDVCTTGSTFVACAQVLKAAGAARVQGFCLARDEQPFDRTGQIATISAAFPPADRHK
jgi:ComF family protein